jgi:glycosyltransferase involved in cell wall biosynthesis
MTQAAPEEEQQTEVNRQLSVVILTLDEERNLPACLQSLDGLDAEVFVVDSGSTDETVRVAKEAGGHVCHHEFENYAAQRNWTFENLPIGTPWTLCLDADERLTPELRQEITECISIPAGGPDGYMMKRRTYFLGKWVRHGGQYPAYHLRLFKTGKGRCENRLYDQHFLVEGRVASLKHDYIDIITADLSSWIDRHNRWASLEASEILSQKSRQQRVQENIVVPDLFGTPIQRKRFLRSIVYQNFPLFLRPFLFWIYGYVFRVGFLDGMPGLIFHTLQRFWFRFLVDAKIYEQRTNSRRESSP